MKRILLISTFVLSLLISSFSLCFASSYSTYATISQNSTQVQNLISYASNYDGFFDSDYIVAQTGQYEYILAFGELEGDSSYIEGVSKIVRYARGTDNRYQYYTANDDNFSLSIADGVVSSIEGVGSTSSLFSQLEFYHYAKFLMIFVVALGFAHLWVRR